MRSASVHLRLTNDWRPFLCAVTHLMACPHHSPKRAKRVSHQLPSAKLHRSLKCVWDSLPSIRWTLAALVVTPAQSVV
jgi:hypothetical protein